MKSTLIEIFLERNVCKMVIIKEKLQSNLWTQQKKKTALKYYLQLVSDLCFFSVVKKKGKEYSILLCFEENATCAGILEQSMGTRNRVGIRFSYRPANPRRLAQSIPWNRFLKGSLTVKNTVSVISSEGRSGGQEGYFVGMYFLRFQPRLKCFKK